VDISSQKGPLTVGLQEEPTKYSQKINWIPSYEQGTNNNKQGIQENNKEQTTTSKESKRTNHNREKQRAACGPQPGFF
jgi:hypothetical protein